MNNEDKSLLLQDLCARLPWGVKVQYNNKIYSVDYVSAEYEEVKLDILDNYTVGISEIEPYLRPISSMTEEEKKEFQACHCIYGLHPDFQPMMCNLANELNMFDWLNAHHFDYRGLIGKGFAINCTNLNIY